MVKVRTEALRVDENKIRENIIAGGIARRVAPHPITLNLEDESFRWLYQDDNVYLRQTMDFDKTPYRSNFGTRQVIVSAPGIHDGLHYKRMELRRVKRDILGLDDRQNALAKYFKRAEDRIFFAGNDPGTVATPLADPVPVSTTGTVAQIKAAPGSYGSINATTELNLTSIPTMTDTLEKMFVQMADALEEPSLKAYPAKLVCSSDVGSRINGFVDSATSRTMAEVMTNQLNLRGAPGGGEILVTNMLGATLTYGKLGRTGTGGVDGGPQIKVSVPTLNAMLMLVNENFSMVNTSKFTKTQKEDPLDGLLVNFEEKYVPTFKNALGNIFSETVDIVS